MRVLPILRWYPFVIMFGHRTVPVGRWLVQYLAALDDVLRFDGPVPDHDVCPSSGAPHLPLSGPDLRLTSRAYDFAGGLHPLPGLGVRQFAVWLF